MTTFIYPGPPKPSRWRRFARWVERDFHRYGTNALLLGFVIYALAASVQWHDLAK